MELIRKAPPAGGRQGGFTLVELMVAVAIAAILAAIAYPSYAAYVTRSRVPAALVELSVVELRMEQRYQDSGSYGTSVCAVPMPTAKDFAISCTVTNGGQGYVATATGQGSMWGYVFTIDQNGRRATLAHPRGVPATHCWTMKGSTCDV